MSDPIYVVVSKVSGEVIRGFALDPQVHGYDGFEFEAGLHKVVRYEPARKAIPVPAVQNIEGRLRHRASRVKDDKDRKFLLALANTIDKLVKEFGA